MKDETNESRAELAKAIALLGGFSTVARIVERSPRAVRKWRDDGLPRTEWTGETNYAEQLEKASRGKVKKSILLRRA